MGVRISPVAPLLKFMVPIQEKINRKHVILKYADNSLRTMSYPKFLLQKELGMDLSNNDITADHIDNNFQNNEISNLNPLSRSANVKKAQNSKTVFDDYTCSFCSRIYTARISQVKHSIKQGKFNRFCSRQCAGKFSGLAGTNH